MRFLILVIFLCGCSDDREDCMIEMTTRSEMVSNYGTAKNVREALTYDQAKEVCGVGK